MINTIVGFWETMCCTMIIQEIELILGVDLRNHLVKLPDQEYIIDAKLLKSILQKQLPTILSRCIERNKVYESINSDRFLVDFYNVIRQIRTHRGELKVRENYS